MPDFERKQFTFYRSFYEAVKDLPDNMFAPVMKAVCEYALNGVELELDPIPSALFTLIKPNLESSRRRAENGKLGGDTEKQTESKCEANGKQTESKPKANALLVESKKEKEIEIEVKKEIENDYIPPKPPNGQRDEEFERFWSAYPKKVGKQSARKVFDTVIKKTSVETLLSAVEQQKRSTQWSRDNGQYIPNPATWLNQGRWEDELPAKPGSASAASYDMSAQMDRMRKWLEEGNI